MLVRKLLFIVFLCIAFAASAQQQAVNFPKLTITASSAPVTTPATPVKQTGTVNSSPAQSKKTPVRANTLPTPVITPDQTVYCAEEVATLSSGVPASPGYTITWYLNDSPVAKGNGLPTLQTSVAGTYTVTITSTTGDIEPKTSAPYQLSFAPAPMLSNFPNEATVCTPVPLGVMVSVGNTLRYRWYTNGALNGDTTNTFMASETGQYRVEVSSCPNSWISSNTLSLTVVNLPELVIAQDRPYYCAGEGATLTLNVPSYSYFTVTWYFNGAELPAYTNQHSIVTTTAGSYSASITSNVAPTTGPPCTSAATPITLSFEPLPTLSITQQTTKTLCTGQTVKLTAIHSAGSILWSTGDTTDNINVIQSGTYTAIVTAATGCQKDTSITLKFLPSPVFKVNDTSICVYKEQTITLNAPAGFPAYSWNGSPGSETYVVRQPGTVTLTVTDTSGCQATQQINVADYCAEVFIPNTITPNGDGVNDTWLIEGTDESVIVKIFTRWGHQVFNSIGYGIPFDGTYGGKKLPTGVYYYVVTDRNNTRRFSGSLTILY
jgi:gliding motility-associated-like protein